MRSEFYVAFSALSIMLGIHQVDGQKVVVESGQEPLSVGLNSKYFEDNPVIGPDGEAIYFTRAGHPQNTGGVNDKGDIWYAGRFEDGTWGPAQLMGPPLNNADRNSIIGFLESGEAVLLNFHYSGKRTNGALSLSQSTGQSWSKPRDMDIPYFKSQSEFRSATVSPDGRTMVFSIMSYGSYGVEDLYFSQLKPNGEWSDLRNLGPVVNTPYQELTPFIAPDNKHIYFASNGHPGEGGLDIFVVQRLDDTWRNWSPPVNLGPLVNTIGSETGFSFLPQHDWAVLISTQNSDGYGDLKKVRISFPEDFVAPEGQDSVVAQMIAPVINSERQVSSSPVIDNENSKNFSGRIISAKDQSVIDGQVILISEFDSLVVGSDDDGFKIDLKPADYQMVVKAADFLEFDSAFTVTEGQSILKDIPLQPLEVGRVITMKNVLFERGTTNLVPGSEKDLEAVLHMLQENPSIEIEVAGHTDNQGNFKLNVELSQQRVDKVIEYLTDRGIGKRRLSGKGWGPMKPVANNNTEETRRLNRRVEFTIVKK